MNITNFIASLKAAGNTPEQILIALQEHHKLQKEDTRIRVKKHRENNRPVTSVTPNTLHDKLSLNNNNHVTPNTLHSTNILTSLSSLPKESKKDIIVTKMPFNKIPPGWKEWTKKELGWSEDVISDTWQIFYEYWVNGKGKATKREKWGATWRTWCRNQNQRGGNNIPKNIQKPKNPGVITL